MKRLFSTLTIIISVITQFCAYAQTTDNQKLVPTQPIVTKGKLLYQSNLDSLESVQNWSMEGPGQIEFKDGWMKMYSPNETMHHVFWCPQNFPESFIAQWQVQNLSTEAGLVIIFFAALGVNREDILNGKLNKRDGTFTQYTQGEMNNYHISYYANAAHNLDRPHANLRKNHGFNLVQEGQRGIPTKSTDIHKVKLIKNGNHIIMSIDEQVIIDYIDTGENDFPALGTGKIGFRQMKWTEFQYRDFSVWSIK